MIKAGIIGGAGYTAGELIRLLINHPEVDIHFVHSVSNAGNKITDVHGGLLGETELLFSDRYPLEEIDVLFLCSAHGDSKRFVDENNIPPQLKLIDLSTDYRQARSDHDFVYGLPELNMAQIRNAQHLANPGCFATAIQLALLPLASAQLLHDEIHVHAVTGSTGAGVKPTATGHFSWRDNNLSIYKPFEHQHLSEIRQSIRQLQPDFDRAVNFIPLRGDFPRGIFASVYLPCALSAESVMALYRQYYQNAAFTFVTDKNPDLKAVVNTNKCILFPEKHGDKLLIVSVIDNLLKGASGQAVQNFNLMFGLDEHTALRLKPSAF